MTNPNNLIKTLIKSDRVAASFKVLQSWLTRLIAIEGTEENIEKASVKVRGTGIELSYDDLVFTDSQGRRVTLEEIKETIRYAESLRRFLTTESIPKTMLGISKAGGDRLKEFALLQDPNKVYETDDEGNIVQSEKTELPSGITDPVANSLYATDNDADMVLIPRDTYQAASNVLNAIASLSATPDTVIGRNNTGNIANLTKGQSNNQVLTLLSALSSQLDGNGKLPPNKLLATNADGDIELIDKALSSPVGFVKVVHRLATASLGGNPLNDKQWSVVPLNTLIHNVGSIIQSFGNNQIVVKPGEYIITGRAFCCGVTRSQARLWDVTNSQTLGTGESMGGSVDTFAPGLTLTQSSLVSNYVSFSDMTTIRLEVIVTRSHQYGASFGVNVFGDNPSIHVPQDQGQGEYFSSLTIQRVA
ncbi:MAG: hypothetical protein F6K14_30900 [Symploca sp. SIO2C1]|nr:hypothetical protein [Symploca sp. SIO2C1]